MYSSYKNHKILDRWRSLNSNRGLQTLAILYQNPKQNKPPIFCWLFRITAGAGVPGIDPDSDFFSVPRDVRSVRLTVLSACAQSVATMLTEGKVTQDTCESLLDHIYAELNRRLNKVKP